MHAGVLRDIALEEKEKAEAAILAAAVKDRGGDDGKAVKDRGGDDGKETTFNHKETSLPTTTTTNSSGMTNSALVVVESKVPVMTVVAMKAEKTTPSSAKNNTIKTSVKQQQQQQPVSMECEGDICRLSVKRTIPLPIQSLK